MRSTDDAGGATERAARRTGGAAAGRSGRMQAAGFLAALPYVTVVVALHPSRSLLPWPCVALALGGCIRRRGSHMHFTESGGWLGRFIRTPGPVVFNQSVHFHFFRCHSPRIFCQTRNIECYFIPKLGHGRRRRQSLHWRHLHRRLSSPSLFVDFILGHRRDVHQRSPLARWRLSPLSSFFALALW